MLPKYELPDYKAPAAIQEHALEMGPDDTSLISHRLRLERAKRNLEPLGRIKQLLEDIGCTVLALADEISTRT